MTTIEKTVEEFAAALRSLDSYNPDIVDNFRDMLRLEATPAAYWEIFDIGGFKECYDIGSDNCIVKFATVDNYTKRETEIYNLAIDNGLDKCFPKTFYIKLPKILPGNNITEEYDEVAKLDYVIIQQRVETIAEDDPTNQEMFKGIGFITQEQEYYKNPIPASENTVYTYDYIDRININSRTFIENISNKYGIEYLNKLFHFIEENEIYDLSLKNIGYLKNWDPVILDWLS